MARYVYERPSYEEIDALAGELHEKIYKEAPDFDALVAVGTGGFVVFRMVYDRERGIGKETPYFPIYSKRYESIGTVRKEPIIKFPEYAKEEFKGKKLVLVDDVGDEGDTLVAACKVCRTEISDRLVAATLHKKPHCSNLGVPHIYVKLTPNWIIYPWENREAARDIISISREKGWKLEELVDEFIAAQFTQQRLASFIDQNQHNEFGQLAQEALQYLPPGPL